MIDCRTKINGLLHLPDAMSSVLLSKILLSRHHVHVGSWIGNLSRFRHTLAIARDLPDSFVDAVTMNDETQAPKVSLDVARQQHQNYVECLRKYVPTICLPALEEYPDCLFVEDTVVAIGRDAVITRPGHESRVGEIRAIHSILQQLGMSIRHDMSSIIDPPQQHNNTNTDRGGEVRFITCDGGDVLFTGRHLFVGLSHRTSPEACDILQRAFPHVPVMPVPMAQSSSSSTGMNVLHLKSAVTNLDETTLLAPEGELGDTLLHAMQADSLGYTDVRLPDLLSCNAVVVRNQHVIAQDSICTVSKQRLYDAVVQQRNMTIDFVNTSELAKKDAALTCCSVLLKI